MLLFAVGGWFSAAQETWADSYCQRTDYQTAKTGRPYNVQKLGLCCICIQSLLSAFLYRQLLYVWFRKYSDIVARCLWQACGSTAFVFWWICNCDVVIWYYFCMLKQVNIVRLSEEFRAAGYSDCYAIFCGRYSAFSAACATLFAYITLGFTVFHRLWNFKLCCGICPFHGILQKMRNYR